MEDHRISTADIRNLFDRQWVAISKNGFSAIRPPAKKQEDSDVLQGFADDNLSLLRRLVHMSESINISYEDGRYARIQFYIPGFSDQDAFFPPVNMPETMDEFRAWVESIQSSTPVQEDYLISAVFEDKSPTSIRGKLRWDGFLELVKRLDYMLHGYSCEAYKPDRTGVGSAKFIAPMPDDATGFSVRIEDGVLRVFRELLDYSEFFELDFSCYQDYSALDMYFTV